MSFNVHQQANNVWSVTSHQQANNVWSGLFLKWESINDGHWWTLSESPAYMDGMDRHVIDSDGTHIKQKFPSMVDFKNFQRN